MQQVENPMVDTPIVDKVCGSDALGNEIWKGDELLEFDGEAFVVNELSYETVEVLELIGASRKIAK